jgi:hypothetical protein
VTILGIESPHKCKTCPHSLQEPMNDMFCQEGPPHISFLVVPDPSTKEGWKVQTVSGWPVVRPEQSCGRHPARAALAAQMAVNRVPGPSEAVRRPFDALSGAGG